MAGRNSLGIDIGGTKIAAALFDANGQLLVDCVVATPNDYAQMLDVCVDFIHRCSGFGEMDVGIGLPGQIHAESGCVTAPNIPYMMEKPFVKDVEGLVGYPIECGNDADCAALAEAKEGAGRGAETCFMVTLGTGVGGAYVLNGRTISGTNGLCCEIGHLPLPCYDPRTDGKLPSCNCGRTGCAEAFVNIEGFKRLALRYGLSDMEPKQLGAVLEEDSRAQALLENYTDLLAKTLSNIIFTYDPEVIILGGGLAQLPRLIDMVPKRLAAYVLGKPLLTKFKLAQLGPRAGVRGAALLAAGA